MKKILFSQFFVYPTIIIGIIFGIQEKFPDNIFIQLITQTLEYQNLSGIPLTYQIILYGYVVGFSYGTLSILLRAREFRGILFLVIFGFKLFVTYVFAYYGLLLMAIEVVFLPILYVLHKSHQKRSRKNENKHLIESLLKAMSRKEAKVEN